MATRTKGEEKDFLQLARDRKKQADDAYEKQLQRELDDLRFYADDQWEPEAIASRAPMPNHVPPIAGRPYLTINMLRDPIRHVEAEAEQTDLGPEIVPADDFAGLVGPIDDTEIELREGLVRKIQRESSARDARNWAAQRARICGQGYYVVMTRYTSARNMDQEVYVEKLYNQSSVRLDPSHEKEDGSDCDWEFYGTKLSWAEYKAQHPTRESKPSRKDQDADNEEWRALGDEAPDWFVGEGDTRYVYVMNYFYTERESVTLVQVDGQLVPLKEVKDEGTIEKDADGKRIERREVKKTIHWAKIDGAQVLDETDWESPLMPIVKVIGEELQPYDEERRCQGMVRPARSAQRGFNAMATTEVEIALMLPKTPVAGVAGQFEGFESQWDQANIRNIGRLEYNAYTDKYTPMQGPPLPPPQPLQRNSDIAVFDGLRNMFSQAIRSTTGTPDATLGNVDPSIRSGRGIRALQDAAKQGTSGYLANLVKSVTYEAKVINSLLYPIYGRRPGRLVQIMTGKHDTAGMLVGKPFVRDAKERPIPVDPQAPPPPGQEPKTYQLTADAEFNVAIRVSKDYDTQRQEQTSTLGSLLEANPQLITWFGDLYFDNQDGPGHKDLADRAKLMLAPPILASLNKDKNAQIPPEIQAQMQQLQQALQQAQQVIQTDQVKQQAMLQSAQMKAQADAQSTQAEIAAKLKICELEGQVALQKAAMDNETKLRLEELKLRGLAMQAEIDAREAELARQSGVQAQYVDQAHETAQTASAQSHEAQLAAQGQQVSQQEADASRQHEAQMQAQQAAMAQQAGPNGAGA